MPITKKQIDLMTRIVGWKRKIDSMKLYLSKYKTVPNENHIKIKLDRIQDAYDKINIVEEMKLAEDESYKLPSAFLGTFHNKGSVFENSEKDFTSIEAIIEEEEKANNPDNF